MDKKQRFWQFDLLRGLAVIGMIVFHAFYMLDFYNVLSQQMRSGWWLVLSLFVQLVFLSFVGMFLSFSALKTEDTKAFYKKQLFRILMLVGLALLISGVTFLVVPGAFVRFGILHCIALCIALLMFVAKKPTVLLAVAFLGIGLFFLRSHFLTDGIIGYIMGLNAEKPFSIDYFPLIPWISVVALGGVCGHIFFQLQQNKIHLNTDEPPILRGVHFLGRHSLLIYLLHIPLLWGGFQLLGVL